MEGHRSRYARDRKLHRLRGRRLRQRQHAPPRDLRARAPRSRTIPGSGQWRTQTSTSSAGRPTSRPALPARHAS
eukprot:8781214-Pyramimonas_sp.AAC.1